MAEQTPSGARTAAVAFVLVTVALDVIAMGLVIPVLPKLVESLSGGDTAHAARIFGVFGIAWALMQLIFSPIHGMLSDRFGRRPVLLLSNLGLGLDYVLCALAPDLTWLFVGRVLSGICAASFSTASAYIADVTPPAERAQKFGLIGAAFGVGFVLGPALGGLLGHADPRLPFWVAAALSLANAAYGYFVLPESLPRDRRAAVFSWAKANPFGALTLLRSNTQLSQLAIIQFLFHVAHAALPAVFVLYAGYRYGWTERDVGLSLAAVGVCAAIVQGGLIRPVVARIGERAALIAGLLFGVAGIRDLRLCHQELDDLCRHPRGDAVGARGCLVASDDVAPRRAGRARAVARRQLQPDGDRQPDRAGALHAGVRLVDRWRARERGASAGSAVPGGRRPARRGGDRRVARDGRASGLDGLTSVASRLG